MEAGGAPQSVTSSDRVGPLARIAAALEEIRDEMIVARKEREAASDAARRYREMQVEMQVEMHRSNVELATIIEGCHGGLK